MTKSRAFRIGQAFGTKGVLAKATQDVPEEVGGGVEEVANTAALGTGTAGEQKFVTSNKSLYIYDGSEWDRIPSGGDEIPTLTTTPASTLDLNADGTTSAVTIAASDPEGFPITYSHDTNPTNPNQVTNIAESNGTFTLTPSTNSAHAGNFTLRLKANDGVHIKSHSVAVSLVFETIFTFNTSLSNVNSNYTANNKVEAVTSRNGPAAISQQSGKLGKGYFEMKLVSRSPNEFFNFFLLGVQVGTNTGGYNASTGVYIRGHQGGAWASGYPDGSATYGLDGGSTMTVGQTLMVAYDTNAGTNGQVWFGKNGTWGRDPASETGFPVGTDASSVGFRPAISYYNSSGSSTTQVEIISHTQGAQYTIPTGWTLA